jgi:hypothetical protein
MKLSLLLLLSVSGVVAKHARATFENLPIGGQIEFKEVVGGVQISTTGFTGLAEEHGPFPYHGNTIVVMLN